VIAYLQPALQSGQNSMYNSEAGHKVHESYLDEQENCALRNIDEIPLYIKLIEQKHGNLRIDVIS